MPLGVGAKVGALAAGKDAPSKLQKYVRYGSMVIASPLGDYETAGCCAMTAKSAVAAVRAHRQSEKSQQ
jgi:hypothetical protein